MDEVVARKMRQVISTMSWKDISDLTNEELKIVIDLIDTIELYRSFDKVPCDVSINTLRGLMHFSDNGQIDECRRKLLCSSDDLN